MKNCYANTLRSFATLRFICCGIALLTGLGLASQAAADNLVGSMVGSVSGSVTNAAGQLVPIEQSAVSGDVAVSTDSQGNIVATVTGTASCTGEVGVHVNYTVSYNTGTGALSGYYTDPADSTTHHTIEFTNLGGLQWQAAIADSVVVDGASRPYNITINLELPATAVYSGSQFPADRQLSGPLSTTLTVVSEPIVMPLFGINQTISIPITVAGQWVANVVPQADGSVVINGSASGTYTSSTIPLSASVTYGGGPISIDISFSLGGEFGGSLFQDSSGALFFAGTYGESIQNLSSNYGISYSVSYNGDMMIEVPVDASTGVASQLPFSFTGAPLITVSGFGSFSVPITVSGTFPFSMN